MAQAGIQHQDEHNTMKPVYRRDLLVREVPAQLRLEMQPIEKRLLNHQTAEQCQLLPFSVFKHNLWNLRHASHNVSLLGLHCR